MCRTSNEPENKIRCVNLNNMLIIISLLGYSKEGENRDIMTKLHTGTIRPPHSTTPTLNPKMHHSRGKPSVDLSSILPHTSFIGGTEHGESSECFGLGHSRGPTMACF